MKKAIAVLLTVILIIGCGVATASADTAKISESLQQLMKEAPDDVKLEVYITLYCNVDKYEARRQAVKECGYIGGLPLNMTLEEVYAYKAVYNRIISEQEAAVSSSFVEKLGIAEEDIVYLGKHPFLIADLTKEQIREAAAFEEVESLDCGDSAPAASDTIIDKKSFVYEEKVKETHPFLYDYDELYYHRDSAGVVDWVLIKGSEATVVPEPIYQLIGNRVVIDSQWTAPFGFGIGVYNVSQNTVTSVYDGMLEQYDGLVEAFNEYGCGRLLGDLDGDDMISVIDATVMQRCEVHIRNYPSDDLICAGEDFDNALTYYSDFNRDGDRNILDVTAIQRYLVDLPY